MLINTSSKEINRAVNIAFSDIDGNIHKFKSGILNEEKEVLIAGADYDRPWTRDTAINTYNFLALYKPEIAKNTLLSVLKANDDEIYIGGQYWDCVIWALGAERYIDTTNDSEFRKIATEAIKNSLSYLEKEELSSDYGLFRGPAVYGDGVSAYPKTYGVSGNSGSILEWPKANPDRKHPAGYGIPMHTLSTNCAYYNAYMAVYRLTENKKYKIKADNLKESILANFYESGQLKYIKGNLGDFFEQEGLGISLGLLFDILPDDILESVQLTKNGIACVYPPYQRYVSGNDLGRHSGTIWSFINCMFGIEALKSGYTDIFDDEFHMLAQKAIRDNQFYEIYHPKTGLPYGGLQEGKKDGSFAKLKSCEHQSWSATGFLSMIIYGLAGAKINSSGVKFNPYLTEEISYVEIKDMTLGEGLVDVKIEGRGSVIKKFSINGEETEPVNIKTKNSDHIKIEIEVTKEVQRPER